MAKRLNGYTKSNKIELSDNEVADEFIDLLKNDFAKIDDAAVHNLRAIIIALLKANSKIRQRVSYGLTGGKRPIRGIPDDLSLAAVERTKLVLAQNRKGKVFDIEAIKHCLETDLMRNGRLKGTPFKPDTSAGKQEIARVVAALVRARKARKSKTP